MIKFIKQNTTSIIVGLVSSIVFLYILEPVLNFVGSSIIFIISYISSTYIDLLFSQVANMEIMDFGFILYMMMCSLLIGGCLGGALIPWISKNKHHMEINSTTNGSDETISSTYRNKKRMLYSIIMIVFSIFIVVHLSTKAYQLSLIGSFKQHMRILAPFITSEQEKIIIRKWSLMNGSNDYDEIYAELNSIAKNNNIILPSNKIYTLYSI